MNNKKIAIIGNGISGKLLAYKMSKLGYIDITIYDVNDNKNIKPWYHVHSGGFLYPEIEKEQSIQLFFECLQTCQYFKKFLIYVPTIIALNESEKNDKFTSDKLIEKCEFIKYEYINYCKSNYPILLDPLNFYKKYSYDEFKNMTKDNIDYFNYHDLFVLNFKNNLNSQKYDKIKYPVVSVMEPKINFIEVLKYLDLFISHKINYKNELVRKINFKEITTKRSNDHSYVIPSNTSEQSNDHSSILADNKFSINDDDEILFDNVYSCTGISLDKIELFINNKKYNNQSNQDSLFESKYSFLAIKDDDNLKTPFEPEIAIIGARNTENGLLELNPYYCDVDYDYKLMHIHWLTNISTILKNEEITSEQSNDNSSVLAGITTKQSNDHSSVHPSNTSEQFNDYSEVSAETIEELIKRSVLFFKVQENEYLQMINKHKMENEPNTIQSIRAINCIIQASKFFNEYHKIKYYDDGFKYGGIQRTIGNTLENRENKIIIDNNFGKLVELHISKGTSSLNTINKALKIHNCVDSDLLNYDITDTKITKLIVFVRHGPRYPIYTINGIRNIRGTASSKSGDLTEIGKEYCKYFGKYMKNVYKNSFLFDIKNTKIITSGISRTNETAQLIYTGIFDSSIENNKICQNDKLYFPKSLNEDEKKYFEQLKNIFSRASFQDARLTDEFSRASFQDARLTDELTKEIFDRNYYSEIIKKMPELELDNYSDSIHSFFDLRQATKYMELENIKTNILNDSDMIKLDLLVNEYMNYIVSDEKCMQIIITDLIKILYDILNDGKGDNFNLICIHDWQIFALAKYFSLDNQKIKIPEYCSNIRIEIVKYSCKIYHDNLLLGQKSIFELLNYTKKSKYE